MGAHPTVLASVSFDLIIVRRFFCWSAQIVAIRIRIRIQILISMDLALRDPDLDQAAVKLTIIKKTRPSFPSKMLKVKQKSKNSTFSVTVKCETGSGFASI
jgi:hypothetical protein